MANEHDMKSANATYGSFIKGTTYGGIAVAVIVLLVVLLIAS
jgi:hypothetical protein